MPLPLELADVVGCEAPCVTEDVEATPVDEKSVVVPFACVGGREPKFETD